MLRPLLALAPFTLLVLPVALVAPSAEAGSDPTPSPVVVELFTSEGCSSCPPADDILAELARGGAADGRPIIALSWHVDYWDRLGWPDPFASPRHTARQQRYAAALGQRGLYTPQAVVDGRVDVVGSRRARLRSAIAAAGGPRAVAVSATVKRDGARYEITPRLKGPTDGARVLVALTESGLSVAVPRGENAGRTLRHDHVVRAFAMTTPGQTVALDAPKGSNPARSAVVILVQGPDGVMRGAARVRPTL